MPTCSRDRRNPGVRHTTRPTAVVVRAVTAAEARDFAHDVSGNEGLAVYGLLGLVEDEVAVNVWLRPEYTDCTPLEHDGEPGVIVVDRWKG